MERFFSNKKAQGISLNVIIIAVLALIVLVVLVIIFTGSTGDVSQDIKSCRGPVFECVDDQAKCDGLESFKCPTGKKCCHAGAVA